MKSIITKFLVIAVSITLFTSCLSKPDHSIRIKNSYIQAMSDVKINNTSYGPIEIGATTDYKPVDDGDFTVTGTTVGGNPLNGTGSVTGKGKHKWTMTIGSNGKLDIEED